jgi:putative salt-induced outer membrane protein YdiY
MLKSFLYFTPKKGICPISHLILHAALICAVLFLIACFSAKAQVNIFTGETTKKMQLNPGWYNSINLDLAYRSGNTEILTLRTRFRSDYLSKTYHGFVFGSLQQGRKNGEFFTNKGMAHGRIIRSLTDHILVESFVQKQYNESILLNDRNLLGGGVRLAIRSPKSRFNLYLGTGAMWEHERINDKIVGEITTRIIRSTNYINWTAQLEERISTSATGYYQVHVRRVADYRILFEGSIMFRLTTKLSFPIRVNFRYDNEPPTGIQKHDMEIFNGLSYTF